MREAIVTAREDRPGEKRLVAYVIAKEDTVMSTADLRDQLLSILPEYMVPSAFVTLLAFPLTPNGKLDRNALPAPDQSAVVSRAYQAPEGDVEIAIAHIWQDLLGLEHIGRHDHFFELGGHSLLVMQMVSRVRKTLNVELAIKDVFVNAQLSKVAQHIERAHASLVPAITLADRTLDLPVSYSQQRLWFLDQLDHAASIAYHMSASLRLSGALNREAFIATLNCIVERHESLRTTFVTVDGEPIQVIGPIDQPFSLVEHDLQLLSEDDQKGEIKLILEAEAKAPFDLEHGPLIRGQLLILSPTEHIILVTQHHIISDGWSMGILTKEVSSIYAAYSQGQPHPLPPLPIQYADYAVWQRQWLQGEVLQQQIDYWKSNLAGAPQLLTLPTDRPRSNEIRVKGDAVYFKIPSDVLNEIRQLCQQTQTTLFMVLTAAFNILLSRYSGQNDICIGTPIANRNQSEVENLVGIFLNTLVIRTQINEAETFVEYLDRVKSVILSAYEHRELPVEKIIEQLKLERSASHGPLFQVLFTLQNTPAASLELNGLSFETEGQTAGTSKLDLSLTITESNHELHATLTYSTDLFNRDSIEKMSEHFLQLIRSLYQNQAIALRIAPFFNQEKRLAIQALSRSKKQLLNTTICEKIINQIDRHPHKNAVISANNSLTYKELGEKIDSLSAYLSNILGDKNVVVALLLEQDVHIIPAIFGTLRAGNAFVPLDPSYPLERLRYMLSDSQAQIVVTNSLNKGLAESIFPDPRNILDIDDIFTSSNSLRSRLISSPDSLAYILYTSGSTGTPKGVLQNHRNILYFYEAYTRSLNITALDTLTLLSSYSFDAAMMDIFGAMLNGATLHIIDPKFSLKEEILKTIDDADLTIYHSTPTLFKHLFDEESNLSLPSLRAIVLGGEPVSNRDIDILKRNFNENILFINGYGPTESTLALQGVFNKSHNFDISGYAHVGTPIDGTEIVLHHPESQPWDFRQGEIFIKSEHLALGYWGNQEQTEKAFGYDSYGKRYYRTGDIGRLLPNDILVITGRIDHQIKIRGIRIELGEIEAKLVTCIGVHEAIVIAREDVPGEKRLIAYVIAQEDAVLSTAALRDQLLSVLPEYMVPSAFVTLLAFPLTPNGKLDRKFLPAPDQSAVVSRAYEAPQGETEIAIANIWQDLLGLERVGRHDQFFELGGHSLLVMQMVSRVRKTLNVELAVKQVFLDAQLDKVAQHIEKAYASLVPAITLVDRKLDLPVSYSQQRLWFLDQLDHAASTAYHMPASLRLSGVLNREALIATLNCIVARHESLRTTFTTVDGQPTQVIGPIDQVFSLVEHDLQSLSEVDQKEQIERTRDAETKSPFDLEQGPLIRGQLLILSQTEHILLVTQHHIISDGWSIGILIKEVSNIYTAYSQGQRHSLPALAIQYADYAVWQREWLQGEVLQQQIDYWKSNLTGAPQLLTLPTDRPRPSEISVKGDAVYFKIRSNVLNELRQLCQQTQTTLFMVLTAAFNILLSRYSGQNDICIGTPIANRNQSEVENLIGFFVNTLVIRTRINETETFVEYLDRVKSVILDAYEHRELPVEKIIGQLKLERSASHGPLFQVLFTLQNTPNASLELKDLSFGVEEQSVSTSKLDLSLTITESKHELNATLTYSTDLFNRDSIERMSKCLTHLLEQLVIKKSERLVSLDLLNVEDKIILAKFNETAYELQDESIVEKFYEKARIFPEKIAIIENDIEITYAELNVFSNKIAHYLNSLGADSTKRIMICMDRSALSIQTILAIIKSGAAYVPIDPYIPAARIKWFLQDIKPHLVITDSALNKELFSSDCQVVCLESDIATINACSSLNVNHVSEPNDLAYIMYTSGTSGEPKGVMINHIGLLNRFSWQWRVHGYIEDDVFIHKSPYTFDTSVWEMLLPIINGAKIVVAEHDGHRDPVYLWKLVKEKNVTVIDFVPSILYEFIKYHKECNRSLPLKHIILGGEQLSLSLVHDCLSSFTARIYNQYGPTETSIGVTAWICPQNPTQVSIGRPIDNVHIHLLDHNRNPVPIGVVGEIYIGGIAVGAGYFNQAELTQQKFISNPCSNNPGDVLYRSGDLGKYLPDGNIEFIGRVDEQVKIRGIRVELGEIEAKLASCHGVREVAVIAREDISGEKRLVAYVIAQENVTLSVADLRDQLLSILPEYMVPSAFVKLLAFPLTPNGKLDRKALPAPDQSSVVSCAYEAPQGEIEISLATIWQELLGLDRVGRRDNFFELGGHSLLVTQMVSRVRKTLNVELAIKDVFVDAQLSKVAQQVEKAHASIVPAITLADRALNLPLSFAQQRLWFLDQLDHAAGFAYHMPASLRLSGNLNREALVATLNCIVERHESLRTTFTTVDGQPIQVIGPIDQAFSLVEHNLQSLSEDDQKDQIELILEFEAKSPFDLEKGPLIRGRLVALSPIEHILLVTQHHIISDGWSIGILIKEVSSIYTAYSQGQPHSLPALAIQYPDYAVWQREWLQGGVLQQQINYWKSHLAGAPQLLSLPTDRPRPSVQSYEGNRIPVSLSTELTQNLRNLSQRHGTTLFMALLAGWSALLSRMSGQNDVVIGTPIANRQRSESESLIGFFVNTLALRVQFDDDPSVAQLLAQVRTNTLEAYAHQDIPFEQVVDAIKPVRSLSHSAVFQAMLVLQNTPVGGELSLPDLNLSGIATSHRTTQFDVTLSLSEAGGFITGSLEYASDLFEQATMERLIGHLQVLLSGMAADETKRISQLPLLTPEQHKQLIVDFNDTAVDYPPNQLIHQLFEAQVANSPDAIAVVFEEQFLTYDALNKRANQVAHALIGLGIRPDDRVAICVERSLEMVVGLLGILKAGGAYVPLDPSYPQERLGHMLTDSEPRALLTHSQLQDTVAHRGQAALSLPTLLLDQPIASPEHNPDAKTLGITPNHLAYVIYTSGSTGVPKGVMIEHGNLVNFLCAMSCRPSITPQDSVLAVTTLSFDIAGLELYLPLINGAKIVLASSAIASDPVLLQKMLQQFSITVMQATPVTWQLLSNSNWEGKKSLKALCGGEALLKSLSNRLRNRVRELWNLYGPTETTIWSTYRNTTLETVSFSLESIGRPIANTQIYILDTHLQPVPLGVAGEIYIGGAGVARGYLNRPDLTAERFIADPFSTKIGARLYKTGDLASYLPDGNIEYIGRNDFQVKIRGFRIELGEIEAKLATCAGVREAIVTAREDVPGEQRLVAYVIAKEDTVLSTADLRDQLSSVLPEYMVPSAFVTLVAFPLTPNGKLDRKALPAPDQSAVVSRAYEAPEGEIEIAIANIWQELLGVERVGRHDQFFELGGHSLLVVRFLSRLHQQYEKELSVRDVFMYPSLENFASLIANNFQPGNDSILMPIRIEGNRTPLFLIHPVEGEIGYAYNLARWIDSDIPIYGLAARGFRSNELPLETVEEMASLYLQEIRKIQSHGPYRIAGWSFGGIVAHEMAAQLIGSDETINFLGLFDTSHTYTRSMVQDNLAYAEMATASMRLESVAPTEIVGQLKTLAESNDIDQLFIFAKANGLLPNDIDQTTFKRHLSVRHGIYKANFHYVIQSISAPISLFKAMEGNGSDSTLGWQKMGGQLQVIPINGTHYTIMDEPNIRLLGEALSAELAASEKTLATHPETLHSPLITIQNGENNCLPVFCIPGAGAGITTFTDLADSLGSHIPVHGLQPRGLDNMLVPYFDVPTAAQSYIKSIQEKYPQGPYQLLGHSFGGWIAFEMATQLKRQGYEIANLIIIDSNSPSVKNKRFTRTETIEELARLYELSLRRPIGISMENLGKLDAEQQLKLLLQRLIEVQIFPPRADLESLRRIVRVFEANLNTSYIPEQIYTEKLHLIEASDCENSLKSEDEIPLDNMKMQWGQYCPDLAYWKIPGNHMTMLKSPNVNKIAHRLRTIFAKQL
ncbi:non-ribosomal peptide synthetase [Massilia pseudoviolaceinigra]|uniref:non-ribosomal peptide synthetase n=1 Tax=Massilia pseudoviolaceinigra TaxID=3057165 RepID=UPI002796CB94|nr:non-ribosomal peptide synthetase [Massilia sp. CCM 9206]MDQ1919132.1 amino acid adenylation domain-containing protein [Massilia sp. CCM 9206]